MFGYKEIDYDVIENFELDVQDSGSTQFFEIRKEKESFRPSHEEVGIKQSDYDRLPYIALYEKSIDGKITLDVLFKYDGDEKYNLEKDWEMLKSDPHVEIKDLLCHRWIENHHIGYSKDGSVTMY